MKKVAEAKTKKTTSKAKDAPIAKKVTRTVASKVASIPKKRTPVNPKVSGFTKSDAGVYMPEVQAKRVSPRIKQVVPASKIKAGMSKAQIAIKEAVESFSEALTEEYSITEIELAISFNAEGKFLGFGVGGETSITVKIAPVN
ncbi:hypothetical protein [Cellvibrio sp. BR]|uniref:Pepco domain-containing protein n=1 Tax=Cellvibrio sp. BR TaxID=1134474 RepID=UPI00058FC685|nr:hypothetical protein [Cellvibrio sp. BR]